jgi:hypothetical protein
MLWGDDGGDELSVMIENEKYYSPTCSPRFVNYSPLESLCTVVSRRERETGF